MSSLVEKGKELLTTTMETAAEKLTGDRHVLTSAFGPPLGDITHSLNVGGYVLASDVSLMEKQQTFNRSKICERMVHPCGAGAYGYFEVTQDVSKFCKAKFLNSVGKRTPIFIRFSTVTYGREFPDSARNPRGFAVKFYTEDGNYDLVGLNFPVFFVRDPALGPDVIRSQQRNPQNFLLNFDSLFDFMANVPEAIHAGTMFFSDFGTPCGFRYMHGYGCHTFKWVNDTGEQFYIKYHFVSQQGIRNFTNEEAVKMCGEDPDFGKRDLYEHIKKGGEATWKAYFQVMTPEQAEASRWDPFDVTKVWPRSEYPMHEFGRLVVNRNPENYHVEVEQAAFSPGSLVPGIEPSPDPLLQFRMFFYRDTQYYRLGVNLHQIPVNCPFRAAGIHPMSRDGLMRIENGKPKEPHYIPNSCPHAPLPDPKYNWQPVKIAGTIDRRAASKHEGKGEDDFLQARELYLRVMTEEERQRLHHNMAMMLKFTDATIQAKMLEMLNKVSSKYAEGVSAELRLESQKVPPEPAARSAPSRE